MRSLAFPPYAKSNSCSLSAVCGRRSDYPHFRSSRSVLGPLLLLFWSRQRRPHDLASFWRDHHWGSSLVDVLLFGSRRRRSHQLLASFFRDLHGGSLVDDVDSPPPQRVKFFRFLAENVSAVSSTLVFTSRAFCASCELSSIHFVPKVAPAARTAVMIAVAQSFSSIAQRLSSVKKLRTARIPSAPGWFSTTTGCPHFLPRPSARMRAIASVWLPAAAANSNA